MNYHPFYFEIQQINFKDSGHISTAFPSVDNYRNPFIRRKVLLVVAMSKLMSCNPEGGEMRDQLINLHPAWHSQSAGPDLRAGLRLVGQGSGLEKAWKDR